MDTILFIPYFIESHILPTLGMMQVLKPKYKVVYAMPSKFRWFADLHQLEYINLESVPFGYGFEKIVRTSEGSKSIYRDSVHDRRNSRIALHREKKLMAITESVKPKFIILDMLSSTDFILLYKYLAEYKAGIAIHNPMLSTYSHDGVPHSGSSLKPPNKFRISFENRLVKSMYHLFSIKDVIINAGYSNKEMIRKEFKRRSIPVKYKLSEGNYFANFFDNIPEIISAPEELEFYMGKSGNNQHYIGLLPDRQRTDSSDTPEFRNLLTEIRDWKKNNKTKIIFCAFGSMSRQSNSIVINFLQKLFTLSISEYNIKLICAFNDKENSIEKATLPGNIYLWKRVPQTEVLRYADLFITHAGLGSIKESIAAGVPMLAYPYTKEWDSNGNAVKVEFHGLGLKGDIVKDKAEVILEKIIAILSDPRYTENILQFREKVRHKYTKEKFLSLVEKLTREQAF